ncbi:MAG TPA: cellulase family glycosylhydrolase, partial [Microlunatus sp.]|nr:cellulase family glycosylhydrolase [Microlunatus sp.]
WLHTDGATIKTADGRPYVIKAVAWFGMETANCAPHGLWQIGLDDGLAQIASFGFTTIRLPFSNECLHASATTGIDARTNPDLVGLSPLLVMDRVVARAKAHGLTVILDRHRPESSAQSPLWYTAQVPESQWIADWRMLAARYADEPTVIGADLHNEPHGQACWGCGDQQRDWAAAATRAGNAVLEENPRLLVIIEGVERQGDGSATWWGGGLADVRQHPVRLAVPDRVVYSPHDYPSSIHPQAWFGDPNYPANLPEQWERTWGYLVTQDIAPVLLGEFGTRLQTASDRQWLTTLVAYLDENEISFAYWSFNPNSGDTGGLVADDWVTPQQAKLDALRPLLGRGTPQPTPTPRPTPTPSSTSTPGSPPTPSSAPSSPASSEPTTSGPTTSADLTGQWRVSSAWSGGYVAEITLRSSSGRTAWSLSYADPAVRSVVNAWGMTCQVADGRVTCTGTDWAAAVPAGGQRVVGLQVVTSGDAPAAPRLDLR